ncbi:MAG: DoxX family protein [Bacteroidia bacterium]
MSDKVKRIISLVLMILVSAMLLMSAGMKLSGAKEITEGFTKAGLIGYLHLIAGLELGSVILFWIPKTRNIGFFLLCSYLGGAMCTEMAGGQAPMAALFIAVLWIAMGLRDQNMFFPAKKA